MSVQRHDLHLLTGSYALDALADDDERADFERHLARCPSCAEETRGLRETAARLAMATAVSPPPELRERVLTAALRTRQLPPPGRHPLARGGDRTGPRRRLLKRTGFTAGVLTLAAAIVVLLFLQVSTSRQLQQAQASNGAIAAVLAAPDARIKLRAGDRRRDGHRRHVAARARGGRHHGGRPVAAAGPGLPALGHDGGGHGPVRGPARGDQFRLDRARPGRRRAAR